MGQKKSGAKPRPLHHLTLTVCVRSDMFGNECVSVGEGRSFSVTVDGVSVVVDPHTRVSGSPPPPEGAAPEPSGQVGVG